MSRPPETSGAGRWRWPLVAALVALYAAFGAFQAYDYDLPLHLITGEYLWKDPSTVDRNIFSFTNPDYQWLNDKWLENLLVHGIDAAGGAPGLVAFRMLLVLGLGALLARAMAAALRPDDPWRLAIGGWLLAVFPFLAYERFTLRPELLSLLAIAFLLGLLLRDRRGRWEWIVVGALHAVWVNLHGYWFVGLLILLAFVVGDLVEWGTARRGWPRGADPAEARRRAAHRAVLLVAAFAGAFVSPWPLRLAWNPIENLLFVFSGAGAISTINEIRSPFDPLTVHNWAVPFFFGASALIGVLLLLRLPRVRPSEVLLVGGFFTMAAFSRRNVGMFAVVAVVIASVWLGRRAAPRRSLPRWLPATAVAVAALFALGSAWYVATDRFYLSDGTSRRTGFSMSTYTYPKGLADFLLANRPPGPFFNDFASGSYLAYRLYPTYKVFIAGNTFQYPPEFFRRYSIVSLGHEEYRDVAEEYGLNGFALMYSSGDMMPLTRRLLNDPEYALVYLDDNAVLFLRRTPENEPLIAAHRLDLAEVARQRAAEPLPPPPPWWGRARSARGELNRATVAHQAGLYPLAEVEYRRALQIDPGIHEAQEGLGEVILAQGRFAEAGSILAPLREIVPGNAHVVGDLAQVSTGLGSAAASAGDWAEAVARLSEAVDLLELQRQMNPDANPMPAVEATARYNLAYALWRSAGDADRIDQQLRAALLVAPADATLHYRIARLRAGQGRVDDSIEQLASAVAGDPSLRAMAADDAAFLPLRDDPRFRRLLATP